MPLKYSILLVPSVPIITLATDESNSDANDSPADSLTKKLEPASNDIFTSSPLIHLINIKSLVLKADSLPVIVLGDTLLAKFWKSSEPEPADDATEELGESGGGLEEVNGVVITFSGVEFTQGNFGLSTNTNINNFDNVKLK